MTHAQHLANIERIRQELAVAIQALATDEYVDTDETVEATDNYKPDSLRTALDNLDDFIYDFSHD